MRTYEIWSRGKILGETELEMHDVGMNLRSGRFCPRPDYFGVRSVFKAYSVAMDMDRVAQPTALADYYRMRDELQLTIREVGGAEVPSSAVHIVDLDDSSDEIQVEVYPPST